MKRKEILDCLGYTVPETRKVRILIHTDAKNEADDQYAILHHLLTPTFEVKGIIASHFEGRYTCARKFGWSMTPEREKAYYIGEGESMERSFQELQKLLKLADIEDIPIARGCEKALENEMDTPWSEGVEMIIRECLREDDRPLYVAMQGGLTDLAAALNRCPEIADKMTVIWIGGAPYPKGGIEFNMMQDVCAARVLFSSKAALWQIPSNVYQEVEVSLADLAQKVRPCGKIGNYLFQQLLDTNDYLCKFEDDIRRGENWCLGDSPTVGVLLQNGQRQQYRIQKAPFIRDDMTYEENPQGREIRVYHSIDAKMLLDDFYAKLALCYGKNNEEGC